MCSLWLFLKNKLANFKFVRTEVDKQSVFAARGLEVAQNLRFVFGIQSFDSFEFDDQFVCDQ